MFVVFIFFFKQKTAYEMRISDWSSDVCSSDLYSTCRKPRSILCPAQRPKACRPFTAWSSVSCVCWMHCTSCEAFRLLRHGCASRRLRRSEEHTSELQSLMRISYAVFCLKKKTDKHSSHATTQTEVKQAYSKSTNE